MNRFENSLKGGDLRSIGKANEIVSLINSQKDFDELFSCLQSDDRKVAMRSADAIEKITLQNPEYLQKHNRELYSLAVNAVNIEFKWHIALLLSRLKLTGKKLQSATDILSQWAKDRKESKIVLVNSIQALFELVKANPALWQEFNRILAQLEKEKIPSIIARIRKIRQHLSPADPGQNEYPVSNAEQ